ncbi:hypothetical protein F4808DRAFT_465900 [Astrocystis sublimbata]|nr:hypothetical protein F4808DRAFT_465900 [Astrocystis sublimbata]
MPSPAALATRTMSSRLGTPVLRPARVLAGPASRLLHQTGAPRLPYKDDMDRESVKPKAHEYTASGTDEETAKKHGDAAFNPDKTAPETEKKAAGSGAAQQDKENPLAASPADKDFASGGSSGKSHEGGAPKESGKTRRSGGGSPPKAG